MKVAVVGAGSTYTPELVSGLGGFDVPIDELALMDVDDERLDVVGGLATRMLDRTGWRGDLSLTTDLDRAVEGADFVLVQIRVGGQAARLRDETIPLACGCIGQETTGAGGFAKAMRTVPVMLQIADRVRELAGERRVDRRLHEPGRDRHARAARRRASRRRALQRRDRVPAPSRGAARRGAAARRRRPGRAQPPHVGSARAPRRPRRPAGAPRSTRGRARRAHRDGAQRARRPRACCRRTTSTTSTTTTACSKSCTTRRPSATAVAEIERQLLEMYRDPASTTKPALLEQRGGAFYSEAAVGLVASLLRDDGVVHEVDVRNNGVLAGLADDDVVEVPARVRGGVDRAAAAGAARTRAPRAHPARRRVRAARGRGRGHPRSVDGAEGAARAPAHRPGRADRLRCSKPHCSSRRCRGEARARDRRRQFEDRRRARPRGRRRARCSARRWELAPPSRRRGGARRRRRPDRRARARRGAGGGAAPPRGRRLPRRGGARSRRPPRRGPGPARTRVRNDTFAVLRAGTERRLGCRDHVRRRA